MFKNCFLRYLFLEIPFVSYIEKNTSIERQIGAVQEWNRIDIFEQDILSEKAPKELKKVSFVLLVSQSLCPSTCANSFFGRQELLPVCYL